MARDFRTFLLYGSLSLLFATPGSATALGAAFPAPPPVKALTPEQKERLQERDRLRAQADRDRAMGKLDDALAAAVKALALDREVQGSEHPDVVAALALLAKVHEAREDFGAARKAREEARRSPPGSGGRPAGKPARLARPGPWSIGWQS